MTTNLRHRSRRFIASLLITASAALPLAVANVVTTAAPASASDQGGYITRSEVIARAASWIDRGGLPYSMSAHDPQTGYRQDCSGFVSMAWNLGPGGLNTVSLPNVSFKLNSMEDLLPGDIMLWGGPGTEGAGGHTLIFERWTDASHTAYWTYEQHGPDGTRTDHRVLAKTYMSDKLVPYRYNKIVDDSKPAIATNMDGRAEAFRVSGGTLEHKWQTVANGGWSGWATLGGAGLTGQVAATRNADGRLEAFAVKDGHVINTWQTTPNGGWVNGFGDLGGSGLKSVAAGRNEDGRLELFAVGNDGVLYNKWQTAPGYWAAGWNSLGGSGLLGPVAVGRNDNGTLELMVVGGDAKVYNKWQTGTGWSSGFSYFGLNSVSGVAVGSNADGRLEVFAIGGDGKFYRRWQTSKDPIAWGSWVNSGGTGLRGGVAAGSNLDGRMEVAVIGGDGGYYHQWQTTPNGGWSGAFITL